MTPKSLFSILIKTVGIYLIFTSISLIPQFLSMFVFLKMSEINTANIVLTVFVLLLSVVAYYAIVYLCIMKTDMIVTQLRLDKGFTEEKFELNMHRSTLLRIVVMVMGGLMIVQSLPDFCQQIYTYIKMQPLTFMENPNGGWLILYSVRLVFGFILLTNSRFIVNFIELQRKR